MSGYIEIDGLTHLKEFALLSIVSAVIGIVGIVLGILAFLGFPLIGGFIMLFTFLLFASLAIISYIQLYRGYRRLSEVRQQFKTPKFGVLLIFISLTLAIVALISLLLTEYLIGISESPINILMSEVGALVVVLISVILAFIGWIIALVIGSYNLADIYSANEFRTAGTLFLIGIILVLIPLVNFIGAALTFVGFIIFYDASKGVINKLRSTT